MKAKLGVAIPLFFIAIALLLSGCTTAQTASTAPQVKYQLMLSGQIDGQSFQGIGIGSNATSHQMKVSSNIAVNYFTVQSCHRSIQFSDIIQAAWYDWSSDSKSFTWTYNEAPTIEDDGNCLLRFCAFSKVVGSAPVACAVVDFKNDRYQLPANNICNGENGLFFGTALCHTQQGLIERVQFLNTVMVAPQIQNQTPATGTYWITDQCQGKFIDDKNTLFEYKVPANECAMVFAEVTAPYRKAKVTVIPFTTSVYPGSQ